MSTSRHADRAFQLEIVERLNNTFDIVHQGDILKAGLLSVRGSMEFINGSRYSQRHRGIFLVSEGFRFSLTQGASEW